MQEKGESELTGRVPLQGLLDCDEVFERFGHFASLNSEVARVQEVADPLVMTKTGLGDEG